jgi:hypothetical protein
MALVSVDFVDLANPKVIRKRNTGDRYAVRLNDGVYGAVTAGEAQVIAEAWNRIADEIVERERGAA